MNSIDSPPLRCSVDENSSRCRPTSRHLHQFQFLHVRPRAVRVRLDCRSVESYPIRTFLCQNGFMPFVTKRQPLSLSAKDQQRLEDLRRSRSAEKRQVVHAAILLDSANGMSDNAVAAANGVNRHTVALCVRKCLQFGIEAALGELPRPGKSRRIPDDAIAWVLDCACKKPKDLGYSYELWTYALLQSHVRKHCLAASHPSLVELSRSKLHRILTKSELRPHKVRYYVERRDPEFERKMIEVLHVYKEVEIVNAGLLQGTLKEPSTVTISYDEKPGIQALAADYAGPTASAESVPESSAGLRVQTTGNSIVTGWPGSAYRPRYGDHQ